MKEKIKKLSKDFDGNLKDIEILDLLKIARMSYYKYKKQLSEEIQVQIIKENNL